MRKTRTNRKISFVKKVSGCLAAASILLLCSACSPLENVCESAYDRAREVKGAVGDAASNVKESVKDKAKEGQIYLEKKIRDADLLTPDELLKETQRLLNPSQNDSEGSNSPQIDIYAQLGRDSHKGKNEGNMRVYDDAFLRNQQSSDLTEVTLSQVVDGDTIAVFLDGSFSYVRLIGINTPESVAPEDYTERNGKKNSKEGMDASAHTKELLADKKTVYLEFDQEEYDPYNRILAYVWLSPDRSDITNMLNAKILIDGYAETMFIEPNMKYQRELKALTDERK